MRQHWTRSRQWLNTQNQTTPSNGLVLVTLLPHSVKYKQGILLKKPNYEYMMLQQNGLHQENNMWPLGVLKKRGTTPVTVLDLQFTGANGSTTFTDSSTYGATFTLTGTPTIQDNMGEFIVNGNYIRAPQPVAGLWKWGANDFEITGEFKINSVGGYRGILRQRDVLSSMGIFSLYIDADNSNKLRFQVTTSGGGKTVLHQTAPSANTLHTFKAARHGVYLRLWLNDVESTTPVYIGNDTISLDVTDISVGAVLGGSTYLTLGGRVDNLKIVKFMPV